MPCSRPFGLGLGYPLVLTTLTAPAERIQLLLQSQDEVILNLREESLALDDQRHRRFGHNRAAPSEPSQPSNPDSPQNDGLTESHSSSSISDDKDKTDTKSEDDQDDQDDEPRSIIVPYAYLPYADARDCLERLVDKEGYRSFWRGYRLESARFVLQAILESTLQRKQIFTSWFDLRKWVDITTETWAGSTVWVLGAAIEGTLRGTVALAIVYPLATLHAKMVTDVIRKTKTVKPVTAAAKSDQQNIVEPSLERPVVTDPEAPEWVEHDDSQEANGQFCEAKGTATTQLASSTTSVHLSYKYRDARDTLQSSLENGEGIFGLYKGFSAVVASTFISRFASLALFRVVPPWRSAHTSRTSIGTFLFVFGATSILNLAVYPLSTVCHRRMIASPGRYSSSWDAAKRIVQKQGWRALFKGCEVVIMRGAIIAVVGLVLN